MLFAKVYGYNYILMGLKTANKCFCVSNFISVIAPDRKRRLKLT